MSKPKPFGWLTIVEGKPKITWDKLIKHLPEDSPIPVYIHPPFNTAPPKREWEELDVNDVMGLIAEHITDPSPELMDKLYGLIAEADMLLQEKNSAREH